MIYDRKGNDVAILRIVGKGRVVIGDSFDGLEQEVPFTSLRADGGQAELDAALTRRHEGRRVSADMILATVMALAGERGPKSPRLTRDELRAMRRNGNRTAPQHIQSALIEKAAAKRARKAAQRVA